MALNFKTIGTIRLTVSVNQKAPDYRRLTGNNSSRMIYKNAQEISQEGQWFPTTKKEA